MDNIELQKIWKTLDNELHQKSKEELSLLLESKAKQTLNKYLLFIGISILASIGLLVFLVITSMNRQEDFIYIINNATLGFITIISLISGLFAWNKFRNTRFNQSLKDWLNERINMLSKWLTGKFKTLYFVTIPVFYVLIVLSIHVYFENKSFVDVFKSEESIIGLIVAAPIGLFVSFFVVRKMRKKQLQNLNFLKDLQGRLNRLNQD